MIDVDEVATLLGQKESAIEEQMNRVAVIRGQFGQLRDAVRTALASYGTVEGRLILQRALEARET